MGKHVLNSTCQRERRGESVPPILRKLTQISGELLLLAGGQFATVIDFTPPHES